MPTYEYACTKCGHHVEVFQRFGEDPPEKCEVCGGPLRKVFHPAGILFKGSGFYKTDSRSSSGSKTASKPADKSSESKSSESKSPDPKSSDSKSSGSESSGSKPPAKEKSA